MIIMFPLTWREHQCNDTITTVNLSAAATKYSQVKASIYNIILPVIISLNIILNCISFVNNKQCNKYYMLQYLVMTMKC